MKRRLSILLCLLACLLLAATACSALPTAGDPGVVALQPFTQKDFAIRGLIPNGCREQGPGSFGCPGPEGGEEGMSVVLQQSMTYRLEALVPVVLAETDLAAMPDPTGTYRGAALDWTTYEFQTHVASLGPVLFRANLALAADDSRSYLIALVTQPPDYAANQARYEAIFYHMLYALAPLE